MGFVLDDNDDSITITDADKKKMSDRKKTFEEAERVAPQTVSSYTRETKKQGFEADHEETVGICANCGNYEYVENDVRQIIFSYCSHYNVRIGRHKIGNCNCFQEKLAMTLTQMWQMATFIDIPPDKPKIGF